MAIALAVVGYFTVSGLVVMFFRFTNERDEMMPSSTILLAMAKALREKGYDHKFAFGEGVHSGVHGTQLFPDAMRWMWRDYPK